MPIKITPKLAATLAAAGIQLPYPEPEGKNKYGAIPTVYKGIKYASKAEANYAEFLDASIPYRPGMAWIRQPVFNLGCPENVYRADFLVDYGHEADPLLRVCVIDVKGKRTPKFEHDVKLWKSYGPWPLSIVKRKGKGWETEVIFPRSNP